MNDIVDQAVDILNRGDVIIAPTETVYGIFGDATSTEAIQKIYALKNRPSCNPLIIHVASVDMALDYVDIDLKETELIRLFWENLVVPITFVVKLKPNTPLSKLVTANLPTVAIRRPNNNIALDIIKKFNKPLAVPSANTSSTISPTSYEMVMKDIGPKVPLVIDGGKCLVGLESTILDITKSPYVILRHGGVSLETIQQYMNEKIVENQNDTCVIAPGMMKKHYAPSIPLRMNVEQPDENEAFIAFGKTNLHCECNLSFNSDLNEAARNLFEMVKSCDDPSRFKSIAVMPIPNSGIGRSINDRLKRASYIQRKVVLIILDGFGVSQNIKGNATLEAKYIQDLMKTCPSSLLCASEQCVGLSEGQFGNSEIGHLTIGSGRIIKQKLPMINESISSGEFDQNPELLTFLSKTTTCHIMGLFSDGGIHSHTSHFFHALELLRKRNINIKAHLFLDGRDVAIDDALQTLKNAVDNHDIFLNEIATIQGRYYAMDRDQKWERTEIAYKAIRYGEAAYKNVTNPFNMISEFYKSKTYDETIPPFIMKSYHGMESSDSIWMMNFRTDRIKQILTLFHNDKIKMLNMVDVDREIDQDAYILFKHIPIRNTLGEVVSNYGLKQLRIAETEKYAHVTYFMNGGENITYENEDRVLLKSPNVPDYAETPDMSARLITEKLLDALSSQKYALIITNYANADMIGHTGNLEAAEKSIHFLDQHVKEVVSHARCNGYDVIITADHGNAEFMINDDGSPCKTHTCSKVPFILVSDQSNLFVQDGSLQDVAPTILKLLNIAQPAEMKGTSLM